VWAERDVGCGRVVSREYSGLSAVRRQWAVRRLAAGGEYTDGSAAGGIWVSGSESGANLNPGEFLASPGRQDIIGSGWGHPNGRKHSLRSERTSEHRQRGVGGGGGSQRSAATAKSPGRLLHAVGTH